MILEPPRGSSLLERIGAVKRCWRPLFETGGFYTRDWHRIKCLPHTKEAQVATAVHSGPAVSLSRDDSSGRLESGRMDCAVVSRPLSPTTTRHQAMQYDSEFCIWNLKSVFGSNHNRESHINALIHASLTSHPDYTRSFGDFL